MLSRFVRALALLCSLSTPLVFGGCASDCAEDSATITISGDDYCGTPCSSCGACGSGFSCQFSGARGVCVDEAFLRERGRSTSCVEPCPTGQIRYDDMGTSSCVLVCNVDGECPHCCAEPPDLEVQICLPRAELCN